MNVGSGMLRGITFAKQFPSPQEPTRGLFVAEQVRATRGGVDWRVIAPVPYVPRALSGVLGRPFVRGDDEFQGIPVSRPRYPVLPRRLLYTTVAPAVARAASRSFSDLVARTTPHFVHAHALYPSGAAARRLAAEHGVPLIVTVHGSDLYSNLVRPEWKAELHDVCEAAASIICVSSGLAADLVEHLGVDPSRVSVIPDTYDEDRFAPVDRGGRAGVRARLLTVGRLVEVKGHDVALDAVGALVRRGIDAALTVVGSGPLEGLLRQRAEALGIVDRVSFRGTLDSDRLKAEYEAADVFVLPSHREGFGVVLIEAMATGLPVVATATEGPRDIVRETDGVLVAPGDPEAMATAVFRVLDGAYDSQSIAAGVRDRFGHDAVGTALIERYQAVADAGGRT